MHFDDLFGYFRTAISSHAIDRGEQLSDEGAIGIEERGPACSAPSSKTAEPDTP